MERTFIPGEEWLYMKLYTGFKTADEILTDVLPDILEKFSQESILSNWFFIRYADPHSHLRLRFHVKSYKNYSYILNTIKGAIKEYVNHDLIWKVQLDTYQRELERYGKASIELSENLFFLDSSSTIRLLDLLKGESADFKRSLIALKTIDCILNDFEFDLIRKQVITNQLSSGLKNEFGFVEKEHKVSLDLKYRGLQKPINDIMRNPEEKFDWYEPVNTILTKKSVELRHLSKQLLKMEAEQKLEVPLSNLLGSYIHMMINRLFPTSQRMTEMVLYDLLDKYYTSAIARMKHAHNLTIEEEKIREKEKAFVI